MTTSRTWEQVELEGLDAVAPSDRRSQMMTPAQEHNDDPQVAAFLAMVQTEARLRAEIAELRAECARLNLQVAEGDGQFCRDHNRISMLSLKVDELQAENRMLKEQLCSRDTAVDIEIEGELI